MFLDTSGLMSLIDRHDRHHDDAVTFFDAAEFMICHTFVIAEFIALENARGIPRASCLTFVEDLLKHPNIETIEIESTAAEALAFLNERLDKRYSLCDAMSFLLMRRLRAIDALTSDRHFAQEGFVRLLNP